MRHYQHDLNCTPRFETLGAIQLAGLTDSQDGDGDNTRLRPLQCCRASAQLDSLPWSTVY